MVTVQGVAVIETTPSRNAMMAMISVLACIITLPFSFLSLPWREQNRQNLPTENDWLCAPFKKERAREDSNH
jgi:hypothetical protein